MTAFNQPPLAENGLPQGDGDCYRVAVDVLIALTPEDAFLRRSVDNGAVLVHGYPRLRSDFVDGYPRYGHAWVEVGDVVIDRSNGCDTAIPRDLYYALGCIEESSCHRYTLREAVAKLEQYRHYGPWDGPHGLPAYNLNEDEGADT